MLCLLVLSLVLLLCTLIDRRGDGLPEIEGLQLLETTVASSLDGKPQPLVVGVPASLPATDSTPLLVGIHTWSADYRQMLPQFAPLCAKYGWLMVLPHFRGPNLTSSDCPREAGGSLPAQRDVLDAVEHMRGAYAVDPERLYMIGGSGGGHMSLLMAGKYPDLWAGVSAWCPVSHLPEWHAQDNSYRPHIEAVCGGAPGLSAEVDFEYLRRSPRTFLTNAAATNLQIAHGDKDQTIYVSQTWRTYEALRPLPHRCEFTSWTGGHDLITARGFQWLSEQRRPAAAPRQLHLVSDEGKWFHWLYLEPTAPLTLARCEAVMGAEAPRALTVRVAPLSRVRVRLADLDLPAPSAATCESRAWPFGEHLASGVLELPELQQAAEYVFSF